VSTDAPTSKPEPPPGARSGRPARDMALSLAALLIPIFLLLGAYKLVFSGDAPIPYDASGTWATARHSARFPVLEPTGLPAKWTVISATVTDGTLRVGYVTPGGGGLQLVESGQPVDTLLPAELGTDARPGSLVPIGGRQWREYPQVRHGDRALVLVDDGRTTIAIGTATEAELRTFVDALR
jgi:Protein of unknown function (DUF4245)